LDEWLDSSDLDRSDPSFDAPASDGILTNFADDSDCTSQLSSPAAWMTDGAAGPPSLDILSPAAGIDSEPAKSNTRTAAFHLLPSRSVEVPPKRLPGRQNVIAIVTIAVAAGLLCVLASPLVRGHAKPSVESSADSLSSPEKTSSVPYRSPVAGVDELYLRAVYLYEQRTPESLEHSRDNFNAAIAKDPNYAPAYAGLATAYNLLREYSVMPDAEAYPKAKDAAEHAIALDPRLSEAHASLAFIDFFWSWDTTSAESQFRTALALDPASAVAHHWYGSMLIHEGRYDEAIEQLNIAQRLQPTSPAILSTRALAVGLSGRRGEAVDMLQDLVNETPGVSAPHEILQTLSMVEPREPARYLDEMRRTAELRHSGEMQQVAAAAEHAYRTNGEEGMWTAILATQERLHPGATNRTYLMADAEAAMGRNDAAIADLNQLAQRRAPEVIGVVIDPALSSLRRDRRFSELVATIGLPPLTH
jgi:serine/threonine-protein kinase